MKYRFLLLMMPALILFACQNKNPQPATTISAIDSIPAYKNLNDSIRIFPGDASLFFRRAVRLTQENAHEMAYPDFLKAWILQPTPDHALPFAANLAIIGRHGDRLKLLESVHTDFPDNEQAGRLLADAYAEAGKKEEALHIYRNMLSKDSLDPETLYEKGMLMEQLKDTAAAIAALQKAYAIQGVDTYGLELAHLYAEQKNHRALEICDFILKRDSAGILIDPYFIKGIYYANIKQYPKALAQFDSCIARDWKTTDAYLEKGRIYFHLENFNAAMQTFNMAITVTNTDPDAYFWLGRCYEALHQKMDAISNYRKAVSLDRDFVEARQRLASLEPGFADPSH